jgi:Zn-dependent peptidase ImmA (M78 family)/transcriptional regulator with XRE-family HTH domain
MNVSSKFQHERLAAARDIRGRTGKSIAEAAQISDEWFSAILRGRRTPQAETVAAFSRTLDFPEEFFFRPIELEPPTDAFHFRASSRLAKKDEGAARGLSVIAMELCEWMDETYNLPTAAVPELQDLVGGDVRLEPEQAAESLRLEWGLGYRPIKNLLQLMEAKGIRVFSAGGPIKAIDAFSFRNGETPVVFLNVHKSLERIRFDLAHELGHLVLHSGSFNVDAGRQKEQEANDFAAAFLMPRSDVLGSVRGNISTERVLELKSRWGVSAMALTFRLHKLGVLSEWVYRMQCQQLASRGFRSGEPSSTLQPEQSSLLTQLLDDLRVRGSGFREIAQAVNVRSQDIRDLTLGLVPSSTGRSGKALGTGHLSALRRLD